MECFIVNYTQFNSFYKFILSLSRKINCTSINLTLVRKVLWKLLESFLRLTCWSEFSVTVKCFSPRLFAWIGLIRVWFEKFLYPGTSYSSKLSTTLYSHSDTSDTREKEPDILKWVQRQIRSLLEMTALP